MNHDPLCPCNMYHQPHIKHLRGVCHYCQCDLIELVYENGWNAGYKQCVDEVLGNDRLLHGESRMTHDPLCPCQSHKQPLVQLLSGACHYCEGDVLCECDLIGQVRAAIVDGLKMGLPESPTRDSAVAIATFATSKD